jgi:hypothetical protein
MPLRILAGDGDDKLVNIANYAPKVKPEFNTISIYFSHRICFNIIVFNILSFAYIQVSHTNVPEESPSGNIHGMPLRILAGDGDDKLVNIANYAPKSKSLIPMRTIFSGFTLGA